MNPHANYPLSLFSMISSIRNNWQLEWQFIKREVIGRYRGSMLGITWSFFHPMVMLLVYTFVFSIVFQARMGGINESRVDFALSLFIGMIIHGFFSECINRSPRLIVSNKAYVKKVVFPLEILPLKVVGSALFHSLVSLVVWVMFYLLAHHTIHWTAIFYPLIFLPFLIFTLGVTWVLVSIGVYLRDISHLTGVISTMLLFLSPVFYSPSVLPEPYRSFIYLNPLTFFIEQSRDVLIRGITPDWYLLMLVTLASILIAWVGYAWFQVTRKGFADVL